MTHSLIFSKYRPDIDGLRAVAVLAVIGFHAFPGYFQGGFIGVDVFFVISGFLISNIILERLAQNNFSFTDFYARRIKRIFPALIVVLLACLLLGWLLLLPHEYQNLGKHVLSSAGFVNNVVLNAESGYFDRTAQLKPLLHLWSLSIESQFYLIWPLLLFAAYRWRRLTWVILLGLLISFALNIYWVNSDPDWVFYVPITRFWELFLGSVISCFWLRLQNLNLKYLASVGLCLIIAAVFAFDARLYFPGWWALIPTLGTGFIIMAGQGTWINQYLLGHPLLVFVGLISFPLYLWHWPLLSFARMIEMQTPSVTIRVAALVLSFILAIATYYFFEKPIRSNRKLMAVPLMAGMSIIALCGYSSFSGFLQPLSTQTPGMSEISKAWDDWGYPNQMPTVFLQGDSTDTVLFMGDSNMQQYFPRIEKLYVENRFGMKSAILAAHGGCPPILHIYEDRRPYCKRWLDEVWQMSSDPKISAVVIAAQWFGYLSGEMPTYYYLENDQRYFLTANSPGIDKAFLELRTMIQALKNNHKKVYLLMNIPIGLAFNPLNRVKRDYMGNWAIDYAPVNKNVLMPYHEVSSRLQAIALQTGSQVLDPSKLLCEGDDCLSFNEQGLPIYKDDTHLRAFYVSEHITFFDEILIDPAGVFIERRD